MTEFKPGQRVAHRDVDSPKGGARVGRVEEVIGDEKGSLVVAQWEDDSREGYDDRELKPIVSQSDDTPVILHLRHLRVVLKERRFSLATLIVLLVPFTLIILALTNVISTVEALVIGAVAVGIVFLLASGKTKDS